MIHRISSFDPILFHLSPQRRAAHPEPLGGARAGSTCLGERPGDRRALVLGCALLAIPLRRSIVVSAKSADLSGKMLCLDSASG